jgi:hypothetical protein
MRHLVVILVAVLALGGCVAGSGPTRAAIGAEGAAAPAPELVGTWRGMAFAVPGSNYLISTPVELTIDPDGRWRWTKSGQQQAAGRMRMRGDRVFLHEETAKEDEQTIELMRLGDHLWGVSRAFIPGAMSAVDLRKESS